VPIHIDVATQRVDRIVVKFVGGHRVRLDAGGTLQCATALDLDTVRALIGTRKVGYVFTRSADDLEAECRDLEQRSGKDLADLKIELWIF